MNIHPIGTMHRPSVEVVCIGGSLRQGSFCYRILEHVAGLTNCAGGRAHILDLRSMTLPFCNGDKTDPYPDYPDVARLRAAVSSATGLILATPEYHGGISGVLKNVLDLLDFPHLEGKLIAGISVLGGMSDSNALNDLRRIARWCHAWMIPEQVAIGRARQTFAQGFMKDEELLTRLEALTNSLINNSLRLSAPSPLDPVLLSNADSGLTALPPLHR